MFFNHKYPLICTTAPLLNAQHEWKQVTEGFTKVRYTHFNHLPLPHNLVQSSQMMPHLRINEQTSPVLVRKPRSGSKARSVPKPPDTKRNIIVDLISFEAIPGVLHRGRPYLSPPNEALQMSPPRCPWKR